MSPNAITIVSAIIQIIVMVMIARRCLMLSKCVSGRDKMLFLTGAGVGAFVVVWSITTAFSTVDFHIWQGGNALVRIAISLMAVAFLHLLGRRIAPIK